MKVKKITALVLALCMCTSLVACQGEETAMEVTHVPVEAMRPERGTVTVTTAYMGNVAPEIEVMVYPLVSGTVTETNFKVGDQVAEGDILFKIDDTVAQLQLDSANASYNTASANIDMASGSSRQLQNSQTEAQIDSLRAQRSAYGDTYDSAKSQLSSLNSQMSSLSAAASNAQQAYAAASAEYAAAKSAYETALAADGTVGGDSGTDTEAADGNEEAGTTDTETTDTETTDTETTTSTASLTTLKEQMELKKTAMEQAQQTYEQAASALGSAQATKAQLEATKDQAEVAYDQIDDSVQAAKEAYAITKDQLYSQQDAANQAQLSAASLGVESAKTQLSYYTVKAPVSGIIENISVEKNSMAMAGTPAYIITNKDNMVVTFSVTEAAAKELQIGDIIEAERKGTYYPGKITEIGTMANPQTRLFTVKASLGRADELSTGVSVKVMAESQKAHDVLKVPYDALYFQNGRTYLYCVEDQKAVMKEVTTGLMNDTEVEITEGIDTESLVITTWSSQLENGVSIEVKGEEAE